MGHALYASPGPLLAAAGRLRSEQVGAIDGFLTQIGDNAGRAARSLAFRIRAAAVASEKSASKPLHELLEASGFVVLDAATVPGGFDAIVLHGQGSAGVLDARVSGRAIDLTGWGDMQRYGMQNCIDTVLVVADSATLPRVAGVRGIPASCIALESNGQLLMGPGPAHGARAAPIVLSEIQALAEPVCGYASAARNSFRA